MVAHFFQIGIYLHSYAAKNLIGFELYAKLRLRLRRGAGFPNRFFKSFRLYFDQSKVIVPSCTGLSCTAFMLVTKALMSLR